MTDFERAVAGLDLRFDIAGKGRPLVVTAHASLLCAGCQRIFTGEGKGPTREAALAELAASAESYGWIKAANDYFCSESCQADQAIDITPPKPKALPP